MAPSRQNRRGNCRRGAHKIDVQIVRCNCPGLSRITVRNFLRTLALPNPVEHWSQTTLQTKLIKISAKVARHSRNVTLQTARQANFISRASMCPLTAWETPNPGCSPAKSAQ